MRPSPRHASPIVLSLTVGCLPPSATDECAITTCSTPDASTAVDVSSTTGESGSSTTGGPGSHTLGGDTGEGTGTGGASTTSGPQPAEAPRILSAVWTPNPLTEPGTARLEVVTEDADDLVGWLGDQPFVLAPVDAGSNVYTGEFSVNSELADGTYSITLVPLRGPTEGESEEVDLTVDLFAAGTEAEWDANAGLGTGLAGTILPGPEDDLFEFGTLDPALMSSCALRRRDPDGKSGPDDVIAVQPGKFCTATDAAVDIDGTLLLLSEVQDNGETLWKLDRHDPWDNSLETVLHGPSGMKGNAVAVGPDGQIAVCGAMPTEQNKTDMAIRTENPKGSATFDLKYDGNQLPNKFSEVANDCTFVGSTLVLAGDAFGKHPDFKSGDSRRHTTIQVDLNDTQQATWNVAPKPPAPFVHSSAQAITPDDQGGFITAAHVCPEPCVPQIELRQFAPGGGLLTSFRTTANTTPATGIAWHPAGYAVVSAGEIVTPDWSRAWAQAWIPGHPAELWTFSRSYTEGIHLTFDVAVGKPGWVHLVGIAELAKGLLVPLFVTVYP